MAKCWAGAFLTFLAIGLVDPEAALAGCLSHEVPVLSFANGPGIGVDSLDNAGERAVADTTGIPGRPKPCTGEMCSGRPATPLVPAPAGIRFVASWAILTITTRVQPPERAEALPEDPGGRPAHNPSTIFHPPRLTSPLIPSIANS